MVINIHHIYFSSYCFRSAGVSWNKEIGDSRERFSQVSRLTAEWILFDCTVNTADNATLYFKEINQINVKWLTLKVKPVDTLGTVVHVDNKKVTMPVKNVFNLTNISSSDQGAFTCRVCSQSRNPELLRTGEGKISDALKYVDN